MAAMRVSAASPCPVCGGVEGCSVAADHRVGEMPVRGLVACVRPPAAVKGAEVAGKGEGSWISPFDGPGKSGARFFVDRGSVLEHAGKLRGMAAWEHGRPVTEGVEAAAGWRRVERYAFADARVRAAVLAPLEATPGHVTGVVAMAEDGVVECDGVGPVRLGGEGARLLVCADARVGAVLVADESVAGMYEVWAAGDLKRLAEFTIPFEDADRKVFIAADLTPWDPAAEGGTGGRAGHLAAMRLLSRLRERGLEAEAAVPPTAGVSATDARVLTWAIVPAPRAGEIMAAWTFGGRIEEMPGPDGVVRTRASGREDEAEWEKAPFQADGEGGGIVAAAAPARTRVSGDGDDAEGNGGGGGGNVWNPMGFFETPGGDRIAPKGALARARLMLRMAFSPPEGERANARWTVAYWGSTQQWYRWTGTKYKPVRDEELRSDVLDFYESWKVQNADDKLSRLALSTHQALDIVEAMKGDASVFGEGLPFWAPPTFDKSGEPRFGDTCPPPGGLYGRTAICFENGLLDVAKFKYGREVVLAPHSSLYVSTICLPFELPVVEIREELKRDPHGEGRGGELCARLCPLWIDTVAKQSRESDDYMQALQQAFGNYIDTTIDAKLEQLVYLVGPSGGGKGTIIEVLMALVGPDGYATGSLKDIGDKFEKAAWIGRQIVFFDEVMAGSTTDLVEATRQTLSVVGNAPQTVQMKHRDHLPATKLGVKLLFTGNRVQKFADPAGAFNRRLIVVHVPKAYKGKPDPTFKTRLVKEAPGIMVWALFGLIDLAKEGQIVQPASGLEQRKLFMRLSSRVRAFMADCLHEEEGVSATADLVYRLFGRWCESQGMKVLQQEDFLADLAAAVDGFRSDPLEVMGQPTRVLFGVRPKLAIDLRERETWEREHIRAAHSTILDDGAYLSGNGLEVRSEHADFAPMEFKFKEDEDSDQRRF